MRKIAYNLDRLIDMYVPEDRKLKWQQDVNHYKKSMTIMRKKEKKYTEDEVNQYQFHADKFFHIWVELHGHTGVTNYIHMVGSGHMLEYM